MTPEEYVKTHKEAFRCAFDFLNSHFPPGDGLEWWDQVAKDASAMSEAHDNNKLTIELIAGVMYYLEFEWKLRRKDYETEN